MQDDTLLSVEHLTVSLQQDFRTIPLIHDVSLSVKKGKVLCIVGESGCGKSLTALSILRLLPQSLTMTSGSIRFDGINLPDLSDQEMRHLRGRKIGMIFQEPMTALNPVLTIEEQTVEALTAHGLLPSQTGRAEAIRLLRETGIPAPEKRLSDYPHRFSGGMLQRVMIAAALACRPDLILADEPTTALDSTVQAHILKLLCDLVKERQMSLILITHDLQIVKSIADDVAVMYAGYVLEQAPVSALFTEPLSPYTLGLIQSNPSFSCLPGKSARLHVIPGSVPPPSRLASGCPFRDRCFRSSADCLRLPPLLSHLDGHLVRCAHPGGFSS
ncbi:MAG: ABC transporter ATP-binding protein [Desulfovibrionaceae bacterium]|nr:ABC transporter ATP-binding protein [Desulfovibrionaceae bacterium]